MSDSAKCKVLVVSRLGVFVSPRIRELIRPFYESLRCGVNEIGTILRRGDRPSSTQGRQLELDEFSKEPSSSRKILCCVPLTRLLALS